MKYERLPIILLAAIIASGAVLAADPGHSASSIGPGTFETGNYTFPDSVFITNYLGINTFSPVIALEVNGSGSINGSTLYVNSATSRVGIGTTNPAYKLQVAGTIGASSTVTAPTIIISQTGTAGTTSIRRSSDSNTGIYFPAENTIALATQGNESFRITPAGKVGIGTLKPTAKLEINGTLNATTLLEAGVNVCLSDGTNCPAGATLQNLWETIQADTGSTTANTPTDTLSIAGSTQGIDTSITGDTVTVSFDGSELGNDVIAETAINFATTCSAGNHLYISGGNLACEADDDQPDSDAEVPDAITVSGGTIGSNTISAGSTWTQNGDLNIDAQNNILNITNGSQSITFEPGRAKPVINTTGSSDIVIASSGGNVIIRLG